MRSIPPDLAISALDAAPDAMLIIDAAGVVQFANRQVSALFGYTREQIVGQPIELLMPPRYRGRHGFEPFIAGEWPRSEPLWFLGPLAGLASGLLNRYGF